MNDSYLSEKLQKSMKMASIANNVKPIVNARLFEVIVVLSAIFHDDYKKIEDWLYTDNLSFDNTPPMIFIISGRSDKVLDYIKKKIAASEEKVECKG